ncbi:MAG: hypothetical protein QME57_05255 [Patescibacteria group bacterium]|nr:hypothetical protein [Patescibacteria group bacterium]
MIPIEEKEKMWKRVSKEFPSDPMLRDLHFIRELMSALRKNNERIYKKDIGLLAREEFIEWLKIHPEFATSGDI